MSLGHRIKSLRRSMSLTQQSLADKVGISRIYVQAIESNRRVPSMGILKKIAPSLGVELPYLVQDITADGREDKKNRMQLEDMLITKDVEVWYRSHKLSPEEVKRVNRVIQASLDEWSNEDGEKK